MSLEELIRMINHDFSKIFMEQGFELNYQFERPHPNHIRVGYCSEKLKIKLLFVYEWSTSLYIGTLEKLYKDEMGWFYFERLVDFVLKRPMRWDDDNINKPYKEFLKEDLANSAKEFEKYSNQIFPLFRDKTAVEEWESGFRKYVREETQRRYSQKKT
jgi:hypothetical protein